jgi:hypothetical protein
VTPWTRTLNLDDAHTLLALAQPGRSGTEWAKDCHAALADDLSMPRRREMVRLLRDRMLDWTADGRIARGPFLAGYAAAPATAQVEILDLAWALSHPLTAIATRKLIAPALKAADHDVPLAAIDELVAAEVTSASAESRRKTRTVLVGALQNVGTLVGRGTGQHRSMRAARGVPHPLAFAWLIRKELADRRVKQLSVRDAIEHSLAATFTLCGDAHAEECLSKAAAAGVLVIDGDDVKLA